MVNQFAVKFRKGTVAPFFDANYYSDDQLKEMGGACGTRGKEGKFMSGFGGET
jgi:hypothetical protein